MLAEMPRWLQEHQQRLTHYFSDSSRSESELSLFDEDEKQLGGEQTGRGRVAHTGLRLLRRLPLPSLRRSSAQPRKLHATSYLDGLRGIAAFIVFLHHGTQAFLPSLRPGWASSPDSLNLLALPIVRIIYSGGAMVSIFFVISGYVLSIRPLQLAAKAGRRKIEEQNGLVLGQGRATSDLNAAYANLASGTFRRAPRLIIPCLVSTFITAVIGQMGVFVQGSNIGLQRYYPRAESWIQQFSHWWLQSLYFLNPFSGKHDFEENTWTIPSELKGSLLVFLTVLGLAGKSFRLRRTSIWVGLLYWTWLGTWDHIQFLAGVGIAEWRSSHERDEEKDEIGKVSDRNGAGSTVGHLAMALLALYLLSMPEGDENVANSPGYITLATTLTPQSWHSHFGPQRWWPTWGAILLIATIDHAGQKSIYQRILRTPCAQYLGEISFSLYLLHGMTIYTVGVRVVKFFTEIFGSDTREGYVVSLVFGTGITLPLLFWISQLFTDVVDQGAVNFARWMATW